MEIIKVGEFVKTVIILLKASIVKNANMAITDHLEFLSIQQKHVENVNVIINIQLEIVLKLLVSVNANHNIRANHATNVLKVILNGPHVNHVFVITTVVLVVVIHHVIVNSVI